MDDLDRQNQAGWMPSEAARAMPIQSLDQPYRDATAPAQGTAKSRTVWWRAATFLPAIAATCALIAAFTDWFAMDGFSAFEGVVIALIAFTFFWIALSVSTSFLGVANLLWARPRIAHDGPVPAMKVALLIPVYNEDTADVFGNAAAMLQALDEQKHVHSFDLFILSDTRDPVIADQEERAFLALRAQMGLGSEVFYRRRIENVDRKVGNLADWIENWGGAYDAMLVLDADSLMAGEAIIGLTDALACDPSAGLIQSFPTLFGAQSVFGRVQQFSNRVYGAALAEGLAKWTDREGNYWGHNAIIRSAAFASCAGLPKVKNRKGNGRLILSHDFIEAGLLRRAGWSVRFLPRIGGSYEEVPATLIDYVLRDRRWCQGNLQHLGLLGSRGFHAVSRFHLISGAMGYLMSPAWFALLLVWALVGNGQETNAIRYFSGFDPQVSWPVMSTANSLAILAFMYGMLLAPKLMSAAAASRSGITMRDMGGLFQFLGSLIAEIMLSILYAPIMMVQQTIAVLRTAIGYQEKWNPQQRRGGTYSLGVMIKFHIVETIMGAAMIAGMTQGLVTLWLLPIAISLIGAVPLSALSGVNLGAKGWSGRQMGTPEHLNAPRIIRVAMAERQRFAAVLATPENGIAAE
ncbi:glucans biosynthesis glucosyltransferase MdoH [Loktanella sp. F6476L]|uniref:glucans biosynthesis glucosyltransferase MdoH n=1 Tax=Loktanella sp. F6476L TaxID=2926405 RepID=UPI001FF679E6|nr:glucans biosynthesis glucosyltransferase MdoH [Loktanella sp. F6476L]MCK0120518.1 glucans biosynthesis glucosyltransferase MdoH [Loktanella sp. F6476L]